MFIVYWLILMQSVFKFSNIQINKTLNIINVSTSWQLLVYCYHILYNIYILKNINIAAILLAFNDNINLCSKIKIRLI